MASNQADVFGQMFGQKASDFAGVVAQLAASFNGFRYDIMDTDVWNVLLRNDPAEANRIQWIEILSLAHWAAVIEVLRTSRWLRGITYSMLEGNFNVFCACYRGLLESSGDVFYSLAKVPRDLVDHAETILQVLYKVSDGFFTTGKLEERLWHYAFAGQIKGKPKPEDEYLKACRPTDYVKELEQSEEMSHYGLPGSPLSDCYTFLCGVTHPSNISVGQFLLDTRGPAPLSTLKPTASHDTTRWSGLTYHVTNSLDQEMIRRVCQVHGHIMYPVLETGVGTCLQVLLLLNEFGLEPLRTPNLESLGVIPLMPNWTKVRRTIRMARNKSQQRQKARDSTNQQAHRRLRGKSRQM